VIYYNLSMQCYKQHVYKSNESNHFQNIHGHYFLKLVSFQVFSIIVFGCISAGGYYDHKCQMNDSGACGYGVGIGVMAFLFCIAFLIIDALFDNMSSVQHRKYAVLADLGVSGEDMSIVTIVFLLL